MLRVTNFACARIWKGAEVAASSRLIWRLAAAEGEQMTIIHDPEETRAIAIAGMSLSYALAGMLKRIGVLDTSAIEDTFETALSSLENTFSPDDRPATLARKLLDLMGEQLAGHVKPIGASAPTKRRRAARPVAIETLQPHRSAGPRSRQGAAARKRLPHRTA